MDEEHGRQTIDCCLVLGSSSRVSPNALGSVSAEKVKDPSCLVLLTFHNNTTRAKNGASLKRAPRGRRGHRGSADIPARLADGVFATRRNDVEKSEE